MKMFTFIYNQFCPHMELDYEKKKGKKEYDRDDERG